MNPEVQKLVERWRLHELPEAEVLFLTGAGISNPPPTSFPLGDPLHRLLVSNFSTLVKGEIDALLSCNAWTFEQTCDIIFDECRRWQPNADVNWFWNLLSEIFIYKPNVPWIQSNDFHAYFRAHVEHGGRHFTANLDQFIEQQAMPYQVLTTCMLESNDVPLNVGNIIDEPKIYKFHGDCTIDAVHLQGVLHSIIQDGFGANTRQYWSGVLQSVKLVCICGYGGFDAFDVNRYFEELGEKCFEAKAIWISYAADTELAIVANANPRSAAAMILSRFAESVVLRGEPNELLNVLFTGAAPVVRRFSPGATAQQYAEIFRKNIQAAKQIPGFQGCLDNITQRLMAIVQTSYVLTPSEHEEARRVAYLNAKTRGGGELPPYDPVAASDDFCEAAGRVIRGQA